MRVVAYILTREGREITEAGQKTVCDSVVKLTGATTVEICGGKQYNDSAYFSGILSNKDVVGISMPGECVFINGEQVDTLIELLKEAPEKTSWQVAVEALH